MAGMAIEIVNLPSENGGWWLSIVMAIDSISTHHGHRNRYWMIMVSCPSENGG